jgi:phytoene dehydrogenase-like protein
VSVLFLSSVMIGWLPGSSVRHVLQPPPIAPDDLTGRVWDAVIVGGGHNGLTAAAYLARAGRSVVVLERRSQLGGACTLERPFRDARAIVSPCAYLVGLLDRTVVAELDLARHGYRVTLADPNLWCPLPDGRTVAQYLDPARTAEHLRGQGFSARDVEGVVAYEELFDRLRLALRGGERDAWADASPSREELVELTGDDAGVLFEDSVADVLARYVQDPDLQAALVGQGVIGTMAGPRDPGSAAIHLMHSMGEVEGVGGAWGYVEGGMGRVSAALAAAAAEAGAVLAVDAPVASVLPGDGVVLESGERILGRAVVSNADPKRLLGMLADAPAGFADRVAAWRTDSPVVKLNALLGRLPTWTAAAEGERPERAMISITAGVDGMQAAADACRAGTAAVGFCELYVHTAYDASIAPPGRHMLSVFAQYAPYGTDTAAAGELVLEAIAEHAPDIRDCIEELEVLAPQDIEARIGLTGGHIFQGEALPDQMWDRRWAPRTGIDGVYLCGAATHPGGSVIALNGRNAAMAVLEDLGSPTRR